MEAISLCWRQWPHGWVTGADWCCNVWLEGCFCVVHANQPSQHPSAFPTDPISTSNPVSSTPLVCTCISRLNARVFVRTERIPMSLDVLSASGRVKCRGNNPPTLLVYSIQEPRSWCHCLHELHAVCRTNPLYTPAPWKSNWKIKISSLDIKNRVSSIL